MARKIPAYYLDVLAELHEGHSLGWIAQETGISRRTIQRWQNRYAVPRLSSVEALWALHYRVFEGEN